MNIIAYYRHIYVQFNLGTQQSVFFLFTFKAALAPVAHGARLAEAIK